MLTVTIYVNNVPVEAISAVNVEDIDEETCLYEVYDSKTTIKHNPNDGAIVLAIKMLEALKKMKDVEV